MSSAATAAPVLYGPGIQLYEPSRDRGWIESPGFDLAFFTLSPVLGIIVALLSLYTNKGVYWTIAAVYLIGIPHYLSSLSFYLADDNRSYYWSRRVAFVFGPLVVFAAVIVLRTLHFHEIVVSWMFLWNIYHVAAQSSGITSIYRRLANGLAQERALARGSILCSNAAMVFWHIDRFPPVFIALQWIHPKLPIWAGPVLGVFALGFVLRYALFLRKRPLLPVPELAFLLTSLILFHPYLWLKDYNLATLAMLMGHFSQYLAIVWLLHRRKYAEGSGSIPQRSLAWLSHRTPVLIMLFVACGTVFYAADWGSRHLGHPLAYVTVWNALTLIHFYVDGLVWQFKVPFIQRSMGPYITLDSHRWA